MYQLFSGMKTEIYYGSVVGVITFPEEGPNN
jgi:hypothetical protein